MVLNGERYNIRINERKVHAYGEKHFCFIGGCFGV